MTYAPFDIYIWETSTQIEIRWYANAVGTGVVVNFEVILGSDGSIQFNYEYASGTVTATVGISNGAGHLLAEDLTDINFTASILFVPTYVIHDVAIVTVEPTSNEVTVGDAVDIRVVVENQGESPENVIVTAYAISQRSLIPTAHSTTFTLTKIYLDPSNYIFDTSTVSVGYRFNVTVKVADVEDLSLWQVGIYYNSSMITATRWFEPVWDSQYVFFGKTTQTAEYFGNNFVWVGATLFPMPPAQESFYGSGKLCIIEFEVVAAPLEGQMFSCSLKINNDDTFLLDSKLLDIPVIKEDGYYELHSHIWPSEYIIGVLSVIDLVMGEKVNLTFTWNTSDVVSGAYLIYVVVSRVPYEIDREDNAFYDGIITVKLGEIIVHDVAIIDVSVPFNIAYQGWFINVNVTVANLGNGTETFTVTLYYNNTVIAMESVQNLVPNETLTLSFNWTTIDIPYHHNYTLKAVASMVPGETNTENNVLVDGLIEIRIMGDVNADGVVNMKDIQMVCMAFGAFPGRSNWNFLADLNMDGRVDLRDIGIVCSNYGTGLS